MLRDARDGKFDAVLVRDPSRLSRSNSIKASTELEPLYDGKIVILTVSGLRMDLSDMAGRIQLQLWFEMSHADNHDAIRVIAAGRQPCRARLALGVSPACELIAFAAEGVGALGKIFGNGFFENACHCQRAFRLTTSRPKNSASLSARSNRSDCSPAENFISDCRLRPVCRSIS